MKKRIFAVALAMALAVCLLPGAALAADVADAQALATALGGTGYATVSSNTVTLTGDVQLTGTINITGGTIVLDLGDHTITGAAGADGASSADGGNGSTAITLSGSADLTLQASGTGSIIGGKGGTGSASGGSYGKGGTGGSALRIDGGAFTMNSGSITGGAGGTGGGSYGTGGAGGSALLIKNGTFTISDGSIAGGAGDSSSYSHGSGGIGADITGGTVNSIANGSFAGGVGSSGGAGLRLFGGTLDTISGGSFTGGSGGSGGTGLDFVGGTLNTVSGGSFTGGKIGNIYGGGGNGFRYSPTNPTNPTKVTGGVFKGGTGGGSSGYEGYGLYNNVTSGSQLTISGGVFKGGAGTALGNIATLATGSTAKVGSSANPTDDWNGTDSLSGFRYVTVTAVVPPPPAPASTGGGSSISEDYLMIEGQNGIWPRGSAAGLAFTANGDYGKFLNVWVDGVFVSGSNYTARAGSTIIELKPEYLATLSAGRHALRINYLDGYAETSFTVGAGMANVELPKTGDSSAPSLWFGIALMAGTVLTGSVIIRRRKINE